jgi:uncharacterized protein YjbJ (UPF0337 family)
MWSSRKDKTAGKADTLGGKLLELWAKLTGNRSAGAKGKAARGRGAMRSARGRGKAGAGR